MLFRSMFPSILLVLMATSSTAWIRSRQPNLQAISGHNPLSTRQLPADPTGVKTIITPQGITLRYKEPGKEGVCETTPGVNSYSGYIDLNEDAHTFFWFFEARNNPKEAPVTLWLNGGPGSDSLIGLLQELGPCSVTQNLTTVVNPYSWSEHSNLLFLSQPLGVGFSYSKEEEGSLDPETGVFENSSTAGVQGRYPVANVSELDTTELSAIAAWHVLQGFYDALPKLNSNVTSRKFNLWTESYGGHYGPAFFNYFSERNQLIANNTIKGLHLEMETLGIGNGLIDESIQAPYYPEFAVHNTYGIQAVNDTVYQYMKFACYMENGCLDQLAACAYLDRTTAAGISLCVSAQDMCRDSVESPYYVYSGLGTYDIRHPAQDPTPPKYFINYLNLASTQNALGVNLNYSMSNYDVAFAFQATGDFSYPDYLQDLELLLDQGVRVALYYGDADYACNWFGGEAVSLSVNYTHTAEFNAANYAPFVVGGTEYGQVRQYGNFSFLRMYESGHEVPYYQPAASLEMFNRVLRNVDLASGMTAGG